MLKIEKLGGPQENNLFKGLVSEGVSFRQEYTSKLATFFKLYAKQKVLKLVAITQSLCYESCLMTSPHKFARTLAFL